MTEISRAAQVARLGGDVVSVKDFGAVGDGVTDDTAAIQAAINSALVVEFDEEKSYVLNEALFTRTGTDLRGNGSELISLIQRVVGGKEVPFIGILGGDSVKIHDFTFRMATPSLTFSGYAIKAALSNSSITDITGTDRTTSDTSSDGVHIYNNKFIGIGNYQFIAQGGLHSDIRYVNNTSVGCIRGVALGRSESGSGEGVIIKDNTFMFKEIAGVQSSPIPVAVKVDGFYTGVQISQNYINTLLSNSSTSGVPAIQFECGVTDSFITDNVIKGSGTDGGIWLTIGQADSINTEQAPCRNIKITGNQINCVGLGIFAEMCKSTTIKDNTVYTAGSGITLNVINVNVFPWAADPNAAYFRANWASSAYPENCIISGNEVESTDVSNGSISGINVKGRNVTVSDNDILNAYTGIKLNDPSVETVQLNYIVKGNRVVGDVYGLIAYGTITGLNISNNSFKYGAQNGIRKAPDTVTEFIILGNTLEGTGIPIAIDGGCDKGLINANVCTSGASVSIAVNNSNCTNTQIASNVIDGVVSLASAGANVIEVNSLTF